MKKISVVPLTAEQQKTIDAFVLEQFSIDPYRDSGVMAADATLEDICPGRIVTSNDISSSKKRQNLCLQSNQPTNQQQTAVKQKEQPNMKRTPEETAAIKHLIEQNMDMKPQALAELINSKGVSSTPVQKSYVNFQRFQMRKNGTTDKISKKARKIASTAFSSEPAEYSFEGFLKKIEELAVYGKALREKQKEKIASFLV